MAKMLLYLTAAIGLVFALKLLVLALEPRMAFFPLRGEDATPRDLGIPYDELKLKTSDGETVQAWLLRHAEPQTEVIFFHGNGGNLSMWLEVTGDIYRQGVTVLALDYRGYGVSTGSPSEQGLYRDADAVVRRFWSVDHKPGTPVVYWGRSLGGTVAAYAATVARPDGIILEAGFPDAASVLADSPILRFLALFSTYRFPTGRLLAAYDGPVLMIHGEDDEIAPFPAARGLFEELKGWKRLVAIPRAHHNDVHLVDRDVYWNAVRDFFSHSAGRATHSAGRATHSAGRATN